MLESNISTLKRVLNKTNSKACLKLRGNEIHERRVVALSRISPINVPGIYNVPVL